MMRLRLVAPILVVLAAGSALAGPNDASVSTRSKGVFCAILDQALEAAKEPEPFLSIRTDILGNPGNSRLTMPGFSPGACSVRAGSLYCSQNLAPLELTLENLAADTARCLEMEPEDVEGFQVFDMGKVAIQIESSCTDACHVGRRVTYRVEVD